MRDQHAAYSTLGASLVAGGAVFSLIASAVVHSVPLVALGLSSILVGVVSWSLSRGVVSVPAEASAVLVQAGLENISAVVEEIGLTAPAVYLPGRLAGGAPAALIPVDGDSAGPHVQRPLPSRLIVRYGPGPQDVGLLIRTAGTAAVQLLDGRPGSSPPELEAGLAAVLIGRLDLADRVTAHREEDCVAVEVINARLDQRDLWVCRSLGSPLASIVATLIAEWIDQPVRIQDERWSDRDAVVRVASVDQGT